MMLIGPFFVSIVPGVIILLLTWWFKKKKFSLYVRIAPGIIGVVGAIVMFYIGFVNVRGFEGAGYLFLSIFLIIFAFIALAMEKAIRDTIRRAYYLLN